MLAKNAFEKQGEKSDPVRKSRRMPKKRVLDEEFDEDDQDDEIRYLEKLKTAKIAGYKDTRTDSARKQRKDGKSENMEGTEKSSRDFKKSKPKDVDYEEEELLSDGEPEGKTKKKQKKDLSDLPPENKRELTLTTRQRALLSKDASSESGASQIEFPNGLPPAPPRSKYLYFSFDSGPFDNFLAFYSSICLTCTSQLVCSRAKGGVVRNGTTAEES